MLTTDLDWQRSKRFTTMDKDCLVKYLLHALINRQDRCRLFLKQLKILTSQWESDIHS